MNKKLALVAFGVFNLLYMVPNDFTYAEECEDIAGEIGWKSEGHGDNNPSEKEFFADMDEMTFCEFSKDIDHMKKEGAIREDTKHDWDWFEGTMVYMSASEETQEELKDLYNLPDDGKKNLEAYEFLEAMYS